MLPATSPTDQTDIWSDKICPCQLECRVDCAPSQADVEKLVKVFFTYREALRLAGRCMQSKPHSPGQS